MKHFLFIQTFAVIIFATMSCSEANEPVNSNNAEGTQERISIISDIQGPKMEDSISLGDYGKYKLFLESSDNVIGISSSKPGPLNSPDVKCYAGPTFPSEETKAVENVPAISIDGDLFPMPINTKSCFSQHKQVFGKNIIINISGQTETKSENSGIDVGLYAPKEIEITSPCVDDVNNLLPLCYYDGFEVDWNKDENNRNGVIFILEWIGERVVGDDIPGTYIRRTFVTEDTGSTVFEKSIFNNIPDTGICHLTIVRGDIDIVDFNNLSYKVMAESHELLSFVLIREITKKNI